MIEIKIDTKTLPKDGQRVKWQTHEDQDNGNWKTGVYSDDDGLFLYNMREDRTTSHWDRMWEVLHWEALK